MSLTIRTSAATPLSFLRSLRLVFRDAGEKLLARTASQDVVLEDARRRMKDILNGCRLSGQELKQVAYPLRASQRFLSERYSTTRIRGLERNFLKREGYLIGLEDVESELNLTIPAEPLTIPPSNPGFFADYRNWDIPEELRFVDLSGQRILQARVGNRTVAGRVVDLPMPRVLEHIFSHEFRINKNEGDVRGFWAEDVKIAPSQKPSARISCRFASIDDYQIFVIATKMLLGDPIQIFLEGHYDWRGETLYIPLKPAKSSSLIPLEALFGEVTLILVPLGDDKTIFALDLEDNLLSKNPIVFVEGMTRGLSKASS